MCMTGVVEVGIMEIGGVEVDGGDEVAYLGESIAQEGLKGALELVHVEAVGDLANDFADLGDQRPLLDGCVFVSLQCFLREPGWEVGSYRRGQCRRGRR